MGKNRQRVAFRLNGCMGGGPGQFLLPSLSLHKRHHTGWGHDQIFILPEGTGSGAVQHPSPRPDMQHPHARTATKAGARGGGLGPCQDAWALSSSASTAARRQRTGLLPHGWNPITLARKNDGTGVWSLASLPHSILYRGGGALPWEGPGPKPRTAQP